MEFESTVGDLSSIKKVEKRMLATMTVSFLIRPIMLRKRITRPFFWRLLSIFALVLCIINEKCSTCFILGFEW